MSVTEDRFPPGFFDRADETDDRWFYRQPRLVTHIDDRAIRAVGQIYAQLGIEGSVLDLMSSWVSHFSTPPSRLTVLGMNALELGRNEAATAAVVADLNATPVLPFADGSFDHVVCAVSVDYLTTPLQVFAEVARVLGPGGLFVNVFSNRLFPTKAIRGWLMASEQERVAICEAYYASCSEFGATTSGLAEGTGRRSDPLYAVWASRSS